MSRVIACIVGSVLLQSCVVWPERWREEFFEGITDEGAGREYDDRLTLFVVSTGTSFDRHSPYGFSTRLSNEHVDADSVVINRFSASIEGRSIGEISLHNMHSKQESVSVLRRNGCFVRSFARDCLG